MSKEKIDQIVIHTDSFVKGFLETIDGYRTTMNAQFFTTE